MAARLHGGNHTSRLAEAGSTVQTGPAFSRHKLGSELRLLRIARSLRLEDATAKLDVGRTREVRPRNRFRQHRRRGPRYRNSYSRLRSDR